jgi:hypothetical protein
MVVGWGVAGAVGDCAGAAGTACGLVRPASESIAIRISRILLNRMMLSPKARGPMSIW